MHSRDIVAMLEPDYTINDAFHDGFECGLAYALRYLEEIRKLHMDTDDIAWLAMHLESKKPWKADTEWEAIILNALKRR